MRLLLDEHVSPAVAEGLVRAGGDAVALRAWLGGRYLEAPDETILAEAAREGRVLITYDQRTIPPLLKLWAETGRRHAGVVFVDHRSIPPDDIGALVRALGELLERMGGLDWTDRLVFLRRSPR
jgi:predicted nuclease of predicted toxin-antitoxin system